MAEGCGGHSHSLYIGVEYEPDEKPVKPTPEATAKFYFGAFRNYIAKDIDWRDLVMCYKYFDPDQRKKFRQIAKARPEEVVNRMFDKIEKSHHEDRFVALVEAFKVCDYQKYVNILEGRMIPQDDTAQHLLLEHGKLICDDLLPIQILPSLCAKNVISQKEVEIVRAKEQSEGKWAANFELLHYLPCKSTAWFQQFMESLIDTDQVALAEKIDKDCVEALQRNKSSVNAEEEEGGYLMSCQPVECDSQVKEIYRQVLQGCYTKFIADLTSDTFLDQAVEHKLHDMLSARDIREIRTTSDKNRAILEHVRRKGFHGYQLFKNCLHLSHQTNLIQVMDEMEQSILAEGVKDGEVMEAVVEDYVEGTKSINNLSPYKLDDSVSSVHNPEDGKRNLEFDSLLHNDDNLSVPHSSLRSSIKTDSNLSIRSSRQTSLSSAQSLNPDLCSFSSLLNYGERQSQQNAVDTESNFSIANNEDQTTEFFLGPDETGPKKLLGMDDGGYSANKNDLDRTGRRRPEPEGDEMPSKKDLDRTEKKRLEIEGEMSYSRRDLDRTEKKRLALEGGGARRKTTNQQGLKDNSTSPPEKELKNKTVMDSGAGDMNITEAEQVPLEESDSDHEAEDRDISLRDYQVELAEPAIRGKNVIVVAPTGSGKTRVALRIIQEHIRQQKGKGIAKVIFLVNQVALANQQGEECKRMLPGYKSKVISGETQRSKNECLKDFVDRRDILIVTAQVLLDSLVQKEIPGINVFSLMVFDECHHTHANHAFNQIMGMYMELKFSKQHVDLPQIVGLTASVGVGKAKNEEKAMNHIKNLMANLDAEEISTVSNNMEELRTYVSLPDEETCTVPRRQNDIFGDNVTKLIKTIEQRMSNATVIKEMPEAAKFESVLKSPAQKGNAQYTQWVSKLVKESAKLEKQEARRFLFPLRAHLEYYNNALIIHNDARVEDAVNYLESEMSRWKENARMDDNEERLYSAYQKIKSAAKKDNGTNPKLLKLQEMIIRAYKGDRQDSRGIVFVKTRDLAVAIVSWMKETPGLRELNPTEFLGQNMKSVKGMTKAEQDDALKYFKDGKHKLIIATSVAEEGLDISKCNLVIRYDHVTNEIAMVQSRGRGRAQDSKYILIAESGTGMAEKEELNMIREILMRKAIIQLQKNIRKNPTKFRDELRKFQEEANIERQLKAIKRKGKAIRSGEFELRCFRCDQFICMSSDVKKIQNAHHVIIDERLKERVSFIRMEPMRYIDDQTQMCGKQICKKCGENLGPICTHRNLDFAVAKVEKFLIVDINGRQDNVKRWKSAPFEVADLSLDDFKEIIRVRDSKGDL